MDAEGFGGHEGDLQGIYVTLFITKINLTNQARWFGFTSISSSLCVYF